MLDAGDLNQTPLHEQGSHQLGRADASLQVNPTKDANVRLSCRWALLRLLSWMFANSPLICAHRDLQGLVHGILTFGGSGSWGRGGRLVGSLNASRVASLPGARVAPSSACRADDNSPNWTNIFARAARRSMSSITPRRRRLDAVAEASAQSMPTRMTPNQWPLPKQIDPTTCPC